MKNKLYRLNTFTGYETEAMRKYFIDMAKKGFILSGADPFGWIFERREAREMNYCVEVSGSQTRPREYDDFLSESGRRLICDRNGYSRVFVNDDPNAAPIQTDPAAVADTVKKLYTKNVLPMLLLDCITCIMVLRMNARMFAVNITSDIAISLFVMLTALFIPSLIKLIRTVVYIQKIKRAAAAAGGRKCPTINLAAN